MSDSSQPFIRRPQPHRRSPRSAAALVRVGRPAGGYCYGRSLSAFRKLTVPPDLTSDFDALLELLHTSPRTSIRAAALLAVADGCRLDAALFCSRFRATPDRPLGELQADLAHADPLVRGNAAYLAGCLMRGALATPAGDPARALVPRLLSLLLPCLKDPASTTVKMALTALRTCLSAALGSEHGAILLPAIDAVLALPNAYFVVRLEILALLADLDLLRLNELDSAGAPRQERTVRLVVEWATDADHRVREQAARTLVALVPRLRLSSPLDVLRLRLLLASLTDSPLFPPVSSVRFCAPC